MKYNCNELLSKIFINIFHWPRYSTVLRSQSLFLQINISNKIKPSIDLKWKAPQPAFTGSKLSIETLEQGVKYVQS